MTTVPTTVATAGFHLAARGIRKSFGGVEVLKGVDLDAAGGSVVALLGENGAGKSTLVKILAGDLAPDSGRISLGGPDSAGQLTVASLSPISARRLGIRMIHQELADAPTLTVAENIALGRWPSRLGVVNWRALRRRATQILATLGEPIDLDAPVGALRIGERQMIEIARALSGEARCLILDEPTAALSAEEAERLFAFLARLRQQGAALIYITHRLEEIRQVLTGADDQVVVLRDGGVELRGSAATLSHGEIVSAMVGRAVTEARRPAATPPPDVAEPALSFHQATSTGAFTGIDLEVRAGEVVALYGKLGAGTAEVAEAAFGARQLTGGTIRLRGRPQPIRSPRQAIAAGIGLVAADRQRDGAFMILSVAENLAAPSWPKLARLGAITGRAEAAAYRRWQERLDIRASGDPRQPFRTLSGGNQQKVLLGRWLERDAKVLLLIEPTRGVDIRARQEIYATLRRLATAGVAVLVATSDSEEVVQLADRAAVMSRGRIVAWLAGAEITSQRLTEEAASQR